MFKRMREAREERVIAKLRARIKELETERDEWQGWYYQLDADYDTLVSNYDKLHGAHESMYKVMKTQENQICKLREEVNDWQEAYDEVFSDMVQVQEQYDKLEEQATEYMEQLNYQAQNLRDEFDGAAEYIIELEEALFKENPNHVLVRGMHGYMAEKDAIDAVFRVSDEMLLLNAPIEVNDVNEDVNEVSEYHIVIERGLDMVSDVDEVIFLRELMSEPNEVSEVSKRVEIEARIRRTKDKVRKPQIEKDECSGRVAGRPPVPPRPKKKPRKKVC